MGPELEGLLKKGMSFSLLKGEPLGAFLKIKGESQGADLMKHKVQKVFHLNGAKFVCECLKNPSTDESIFHEDLLLT